VRKGILQASHSARKVPFWSLNQQVVMIAHQHVCMQPETCPLTGFLPGKLGSVILYFIPDCVSCFGR
jgi:hypothetical protein